MMCHMIYYCPAIKLSISHTFGPFLFCITNNWSAKIIIAHAYFLPAYKCLYRSIVFVIPYLPRQLFWSQIRHDYLNTHTQLYTVNPKVYFNLREFSTLDNLSLNFHILDVAFSIYGNGLGFKQTCTSEHGR